MSKKLAAYVHVHRPDGSTVAYGPDDTVPADDAKLIVNDKAWAADEKPAKSDK